MKLRKPSGYWLVVLTSMAGMAMAAWRYGAALYPEPVVRVLAVLLIGAALLLAQGFFGEAWERAARHAREHISQRYTREASAQATSDGSFDHLWKNTLSPALEARHGWCWRYRQPWLLVTGNTQAIAKLLPALVEQNYLLTQDALLLHPPHDEQGAADDGWLKQLYAVRRRRPVDGLVLVIDGETDTLAPGHTLHGPSVHLARITQQLRWSAPVYVLDAAGTDAAHDGATPETGCEFAAAVSPACLEADLLALRDQLAGQGVQRLGANRRDNYLAELSQRLDHRAGTLAAWTTQLSAQRHRMRGVFFAPYPSPDTGVVRAETMLLPVWSYLSRLARRPDGRRATRHPITVSALIVLALVSVWAGGMLLSTFSNARALRTSQLIVHALDEGDDADRLRTLLALQQRIGGYQARVHHPAPGIRGFGLNRDRATLDALWARYTDASRALLTVPVQRSLESTLADLGRLRADALQDRATQQRYYNALKAYLMLADPARADASFLAAQMASALPVVTSMPAGEWRDSSQRLAGFLAEHWKDNPGWRIAPAATLVTTARGALIRQIGLANADDTVYQSVLDTVRGQYADMSLAMLLHGTDAQGLFSTTASVPGLYTRAAWDGMVAAAIDKAANERQVEGDWVLAGPAHTDKAGTPATPQDGTSRPDLKQRLTARYFAEYAAAWQHMLNSLQWQPAANLTAAVDQLTRLTDAQTSPLIALMKSVQLQAQAGRPSQSLGDTLVRRTQGLLGREEAAPAKLVASPLDAPFGPLLALMGDSAVVTGKAGADAHDAPGDAPAALSGVSLQSFLTAAATMRLKLQQVNGSNDPQMMARTLAQAVFQGKFSELAQVREQAALTAASLGKSWAGLGQALFLRPLDGAWQTVLQPAAASLNDSWRNSVAVPFNDTFDGRYPFHDTPADASFDELGRFVRPTSGLIKRFLSDELAGVLTEQGNRWVPGGLAPQTLAFDPEFLKAVQQMTTLGAHFYPTGVARYHVDLLPEPTRNVARSTLTIDATKIVYFNQLQTWTPIQWPGDGLSGQAGLAWDPLGADTRSAFDAEGEWAFLRLLARAEITALDGSRYELAWHPQGADEPLHYVMRTQVGAGPIELLSLRGFKLPERIFVTDAATSKPND